jgi:hypothetical protein
VLFEFFSQSKNNRRHGLVATQHIHTGVPKFVLKRQIFEHQSGRSLNSISVPKQNAPWPAASLPQVFKHLPQPSNLNFNSFLLQPTTIFFNRVILVPTNLKTATNLGARHLLLCSIPSGGGDVSNSRLFDFRSSSRSLGSKPGAVVPFCTEEPVLALGIP